MIRYTVEISGENSALAAAEVAGAAEALEGSVVPAPDAPGPAGSVTVALADDAVARALGARLALAWRVLRPWAPMPTSEVEEEFGRLGRAGRSAAVRPLGAPRGSSADVGRFGRAYCGAGGPIDLERPDRRFFVTPQGPDAWWVGEEIATIDRRAFDARRLPHLPFRRPVSLPPRLGRVLVNLARVRAGTRVVDPFLGTGALLIEAALLGARVSGIDRDPVMVRGALRNFAQLGLRLESAEVDDAGHAAGATAAEVDAVVTDPPYGRSSGSGGEAVDALIGRVLPLWAARVRPGGFVACVAPSGALDLGPGWTPEAAVADRVHRSLTREFRAYRRAGRGQ